MGERKRCHLEWSREMGPRCCLPARHEGPCRYRCANPKCQGELLPASFTPHQHGVRYMALAEDKEQDHE